MIFFGILSLREDSAGDREEGRGNSEVGLIASDHQL